MKDDGSAPWMFVFREGAARIGPRCWLHSGMGFFMKTYATPTFLASIPVQTILDQGMSLHNLKTFLDEEEGINIFKDEGALTYVPEQHIVWVPYGVIAWPAVIAGGCPPEGAPFLTIPVFCKELAKELNSAVWKAVLAYNKPWLDEKQTNEVWKPTVELFRKFSASLG